LSMPSMPRFASMPRALAHTTASRLPRSSTCRARDHQFRLSVLTRSVWSLMNRRQQPCERKTGQHFGQQPRALLERHL
jgi:hypothetical protein